MERLSDKAFAAGQKKFLAGPLTHGKKIPGLPLTHGKETPGSSSKPVFVCQQAVLAVCSTVCVAMLSTLTVILHSER